MPAIERVVPIVGQMSDPIRDMELLYPGTEQLYDAGNHINPMFISKVKNFKLIRFKECMGATTYKELAGDETDPVFPFWTHHIDFNERITPNWYWQNGRRGMALEYVAEICNQARINPWICLPFCCSKQFCFEATKLMMSKLSPDLICYLELGSNMVFWMGNGDMGRNNGFDYMQQQMKTYYAGVPNGVGTGAYINDMFKQIGDGAGQRRRHGTGNLSQPPYGCTDWLHRSPHARPNLHVRFASPFLPALHPDSTLQRGDFPAWRK